jgi:ABC-2 type transport system ATP-binding protein
MTAVVQVNQLTKSYGARPILAGIDLSIREGTVVALLGPNGAGKTTLVRILSTLVAPDSGTATIAGHDVVRDAGKVRSVISLTGQYAAVDDLLTGEENMRLMARLRQLRGAEAKRGIASLLERFDLMEARNRQVRHYSGGMRRKLDLALSLVARPRVLFLDEPTTGLDPRSRFAMWDIVRDLAAGGTTVLLTTQYLDEADRLADTIALVDHGRIIASGTLEQLKGTISGNRVELVFPNEALYQKARWVLDSRAIVEATARLTLRVDTGTGTGDLRSILNDLGDANVQIERISLHEPTLDDVFLNLTGRPAPIEEAA